MQRWETEVVVVVVGVQETSRRKNGVGSTQVGRL